MATPSVHTVQLNQWLDRMRAGDASARDELLRAVSQRLERLARQMLRRFPGVARWEQTDDVLQNALLRLLRALQEVRPASMRDFFGLAATQMRRELLDLARHYQGPEGLGAHHISRHLEPPSAADSQAPVAEPADRAEADADLELWSAFHQAVEQLPAEEREVVSLVFYHGLTQAEVAALSGVAERTIRRRWRSASLKLQDALGGRLPEA
ncbi:MAG: sigma-70 family RNA polymerase sigma factor [Gemmataceae bacterium]|nr:sigma-70 family RNA polymerase sigma factor [Gemmataceae bacterium]